MLLSWFVEVYSGTCAICCVLKNDSNGLHHDAAKIGMSRPRPMPGCCGRRSCGRFGCGGAPANDELADSCLAWVGGSCKIVAGPEGASAGAGSRSKTWTLSAFSAALRRRKALWLSRFCNIRLVEVLVLPFHSSSGPLASACTCKFIGMVGDTAEDVVVNVTVILFIVEAGFECQSEWREVKAKRSRAKRNSLGHKNDYPPIAKLWRKKTVTRLYAAYERMSWRGDISLPDLIMVLSEEDRIRAPDSCVYHQGEAKGDC